MAAPSNRIAKKADWTAWTLHAVFGGVIGFFFSFPLAARLPSDAEHVLEMEGLWRITLGLTLVLTGAASHYGERLWFREGIWASAPPPRSRESRWASMTIGFVGLVVLLSWIPAGWEDASLARSGPGMNGAMRLAFLPLCLLVAAMIVHSLRKERLPEFWGGFTRQENALLYWFTLIAKALALISMLNAMF
ncbi:MAG: hypothetical protein JNG86_09785 [Verrucomicrobiaceae bacterium]|nr:hypothetical protein [Verrucomicrobiaceae bacterium]